MDRRAILAALAAALMACSGEDKPPAMPAVLGGGWKLSGVSNPAPAPLLGSYEPARVWEASYSGTVPLTVTYNRMKSDTVAFELMQKWRSEPGATHFHRGPLFVVIRSAGAEPARLNAIAGEVEEALGR